ncbi:hypothetical protein JCM8547_005679 [Rhodosporidiobolus lusitaniae]
MAPGANAQMFEGAGDALLKQALAEVSLNEDDWIDHNGKKTNYNAALAQHMQALNVAQNLGAPIFSSGDVQNRVRAIDSSLRRHGKMPNVAVADPYYAQNTSTSMYTQGYPANQGEEGWYEEDSNALPTYEAPYNGPSGPQNPYYRSLGHGRASSSSSSGHFARPLRHAVIYGEGRRRF